MMKRANEMPTEGQFLVVWEFNGLPWSSVYRYHDGAMERYELAKGDEWSSNNWIHHEGMTGVEYYVID
jgi:hypothetical protein